MANPKSNWLFCCCRKHIQVHPEVGHVVTEFLPSVSWAGPYNTIVAAAGHHIYEGRWLRDSAILDDYTRFWLWPSARTREYTAWLADAVLARYSHAEAVASFRYTSMFKSKALFAITGTPGWDVMPRNAEFHQLLLSGQAGQGWLTPSLDSADHALENFDAQGRSRPAQTHTP